MSEDRENDDLQGAEPEDDDLQESPEVRPGEGPQAFQVGEWRVEPRLGALARGGESRRVPQRVMAVLVHLAGAGGRVVSKDELVREVWREAFVSDESVAAAIYQLRRALDDDARSPRYLETIRKSGYRLLAPVEAAPPGAVSPDPASQNPPRASFSRISVPRVSSSADSRPARRTPAWRPWLLAGAAVALLVPVLWQLRGKPPTSPLDDAGPEVCRAYLKGAHFLAERTPRGYRKAADYFEEALALDPGFALALAGLADCHAFSGGSRQEALEAAEAAVEAGPALPETHAALANVRFRLEGDAAAAERLLLRALEIDPASAAVRERHAELLAATGRGAQALAVLRAALEADPASKNLHWSLARTLYVAGRPQEAAAQLELALELDPFYPPVYELLGEVALELSRPDEAVASWLKALELTGVPMPERERLGTAYLYGDLEGFYRARLEPEAAAALTPVGRARLLARLGQAEEAHRALEEAARRGDPALVWRDADPVLAQLGAVPAGSSAGK